MSTKKHKMNIKGRKVTFQNMFLVVLLSLNCLLGKKNKVFSFLIESITLGVLYKSSEGPVSCPCLGAYFLLIFSWQ